MHKTFAGYGLGIDLHLCSLFVETQNTSKVRQCCLTRTWTRAHNVINDIKHGALHIESLINAETKRLHDHTTTLPAHAEPSLEDYSCKTPDQLNISRSHFERGFLQFEAITSQLPEYNLAWKLAATYCTVREGGELKERSKKRFVFNVPCGCVFRIKFGKRGDLEPFQGELELTMMASQKVPLTYHRSNDLVLA